MKIIISRICLIAILLCLPPSISYANNTDRVCSSELPLTEKNKKIWYVNLAGISTVTTWGVLKWEYFSRSPQSQSENWFGNNTKSGGTDKLGHLYSSYVTTHGISNLYEFWCINKKDAALYGALSSLAILGYMEVGDSFSDFGFSKEDMIANGVGVLFGYYTYRYPHISNIIDLRWEYKPNSNSEDFITDYENSKYFLALKLNGFDFFRDSFLKHIEFHAGYYTRGFDDLAATKERNVFFGIGINLTDLFRRHSYKKTSILLKYYQIPGTSLQFKNDLND